jgi:hypothetical protein
MYLQQNKLATTLVGVDPWPSHFIAAHELVNK